MLISGTLFTVSIPLKDSTENWDWNSHQKSLSCCSFMAVAQDCSGLAGLATAVTVLWTFQLQEQSHWNKILFSTHFSVPLRKAAAKMLVYRMQFATALYSCCLVVSSYRTQGARFYTTVQRFFFLLGIDGLQDLPSYEHSGSFQESKKLTKRESCLSPWRTPMYFALIGTVHREPQCSQMHCHGFLHCCLRRLNLWVSRNSSAEEEDCPWWR